MLISAFTDALLKSQVLFVNISQCTVWTNTEQTMNDCIFININTNE